ncbi:adenosine deaminase [Rhodobacter sp. NTK016B]|uniref:adenosine deaminase n=1 Tax=Rhodobacter sp. NTK016B TaxID=2759676 RepID=UPI001A8E5770|nr:adenosine deaminase [Rhodobacter sp. NTK016B]MBN8293714.1 adenosine deaminase [Rhodobacter sp. NTK016B]
MTPNFALWPKAELHLHLEGAILPGTAAELAEKNGVDLGAKPEDLYSYADLSEFLAMYGRICQAVVTEEDFQRVTFEMLRECHASGARHVEFFISPHAHEGIPFATQFAGIRAGIAQARETIGLSALFAPGINREQGPEAAMAYLDACLAQRCDAMAGIGLDYNEAPFPPEPFAPVFARARAEGLQVSAHAGEGGPAAYVRGSIEALECQRIDHGYAVMDDPDLVARCRDAGILFTCCPTTTIYTTPWRDLTDPRHPIRRMHEAGLAVTINSDDPPFFSTTLAKEYEIAHRDLGFSLEALKGSVLTGLAKSWLPEAEKTRLAAEWSGEIDALIAGA